MCLAVPGKVLEIYEENGLLMGKIEYSGVVNRACLAYVPEVLAGQFVIVHAGFAITAMDEEEARVSLEALGQLADSQLQDSEAIDRVPDDGEYSS
jgi:hydrogenase expression/formation protein HypC